MVTKVLQGLLVHRDIVLWQMWLEMPSPSLGGQHMERLITKKLGPAHLVSVTVAGLVICLQSLELQRTQKMLMLLIIGVILHLEI